MTIEETIKWFNSIFDVNKGKNDSKKDFYCGITNNIKRREEEHNVLKFLGITKCDSFDTAKVVEARMKAEGYDTGDQIGNGTEDSVFVYLYKKEKNVTKE